MGAEGFCFSLLLPGAHCWYQDAESPLSSPRQSWDSGSPSSVSGLGNTAMGSQSPRERCPLLAGLFWGG